jgi:hypothetical protein
MCPLTLCPRMDSRINSPKEVKTSKTDPPFSFYGKNIVFFILRKLILKLGSLISSIKVVR